MAYLNAAVFLLFSVALLLQVAPGLVKLVSSELYPKDQAQFLIVGDLLSEQRSAVFLWAVLGALGGLLLVVFSRKDAWQAYFACAAALMVMSLLFVQRFDTDLARRYSFKQFTEHVLSTVKDKPLYFYRSGDFGVTFYANRRVPIYTNSFSGEHSPFYLLCWENDWKRIRNTSGVTLEYASENIDRQIPQRGRLYLVEVNGPDKPRTASGRNA